jgi:hypothetical protein
VRRRLVLVFAAVTSMVAIAFIVPLCVLVRDVARERALDGADRDASALFPVLAVTVDPDALDVAVSISSPPTRIVTSPGATAARRMTALSRASS